MQPTNETPRRFNSASRSSAASTRSVVVAFFSSSLSLSLSAPCLFFLFSSLPSSLSDRGSARHPFSPPFTSPLPWSSSRSTSPASLSTSLSPTSHNTPHSQLILRSSSGFFALSSPPICPLSAYFPPRFLPFFYPPTSRSLIESPYIFQCCHFRISNPPSFFFLLFFYYLVWNYTVDGFLSAEFRVLASILPCAV